jgi:hypothetical protein
MACHGGSHTRAMISPTGAFAGGSRPNRTASSTEAELREEYARLDLPPNAKKMFIAGLLRDEVAAEAGADPAAMEAAAMVRQYGLRRAREVFCDPVSTSYMGKVSRDEAKHVARVAAHLDQMRAGLPWWKRLFT